MGKLRQGASQLEMEQSPNQIYVFSTVPRSPSNVPKPSSPEPLQSFIFGLPQAKPRNQSHVRASGNSQITVSSHINKPSPRSRLDASPSLYLSALSPGSQPNPFTMLAPLLTYLAWDRVYPYLEVQVPRTRVLQRQNFSFTALILP